AVHDQIDRAFEFVAIDDDADLIAIANLAERAARERLGADVADAGAGRDSGETRVGQDGNVLAEAEVLERRRDLINFFHGGPHRAAANQYQDIARLEPVRLVAL